MDINELSTTFLNARLELGRALVLAQGELAGAEFNGKNALEAARKEAEASMAAAQQATSALRSVIQSARPRGNVGSLAAQPVALPEVNVQPYNQLVQLYYQWQRRSLLARVFSVNPWNALVREGSRILGDAEDAVVTRARTNERDLEARSAALKTELETKSKAVEAASSAYSKGLNSYEEQFVHSLAAAHLAPGQAACDSREPGDVPESFIGWAGLDPERAWASLPRLAPPTSCFTVVPGSLGLLAGARLAQQWVLGLLASARGRRVQLTWIDAVGRGAGAGPILRLLDIDKELLDGQVWSESDHIAERLRRVTDRVSYIQQRCLQDRFATLAEYNSTAGALAEPYHVVVAIGFPRGFTEEAAERLRSLVSHSKRAGVGVFVVCDEAIGATVRPDPGQGAGIPGWVETYSGVFGTANTDAPSWWRPEEHLLWKAGALAVVGHDDRFWIQMPQNEAFAPLEHSEVSSETAAAVTESYGARSIEARDVAVTIDSPLGPTLQRGDARRSLSVDIGLAGRGERIQLKLGAGMAQNVLVGGLPGSGKSSLFHTLITQAAQQYDWNELELYLLDFKQGVEFKPYATLGLPQARVVAIESEREFGISVLRGLEAELTRRAALFRSSAADSLESYGGDERLPRIVLICDEFQLLLSHDDRLAQEAASLLRTRGRLS